MAGGLRAESWVALSEIAPEILQRHLSLSSLSQARKEINEKVAPGRGKRRKKLVKRETMRILR